MFVIWGFGGRRKYTDVVTKDTCGACGTEQVMNIIVDYGCFTLFFVPIIKFGKKYYEVCPHCGAGRQITKREYNAIKAANRNGLIYGAKDVVVKSEPTQMIEVKAETTSAANTSNSNAIKQEIDKIIKQLEERNYVLTADKLVRFKPVLKEQLMKKFSDESEVNAVIEEYFKDIK